MSVHKDQSTTCSGSASEGGTATADKVQSAKDAATRQRQSGSCTHSTSAVGGKTRVETTTMDWDTNTAGHKFASDRKSSPSQMAVVGGVIAPEHGVAMIGYQYNYDK